jgi:hypothetical protein
MEMTKFGTIILMVAIAGGFLFAHGQHSSVDLLSDSDKALIIESVLDLELRTQASVPDFAYIRKVSDDNIEFIEPSRLSKHGFTLMAASQLRESKKDHIVEYLLFKRIYSRDQVALVALSRVTEGRPCFGQAFFRERTYTYESRRTSSGWVAQLTGKPAHLIGFAPKRFATKR